MKKRVVITGLGTVNPLGNDVNTYWKNLQLGTNGCGPITKFDPQNFKTQFACEVKNFNPLDYLEKKEIRKMDLFTQYALAATQECMDDARFDDTWGKDRVGVIWATGIGGIQTFEEQVMDFCENGEVPRFSPFFITRMIPNMASGLISIRYGLKGISHATVSACASSNTAISEAFHQISLGNVDAMLVGGSEASVTRAAIGGFNASRALSTQNEACQSASKPFDTTRNGFVMGEGAGAIMLEELDHAMKRGATIYAEIAGVGATSDAYHMTASHPEGRGLRLAMEQAISEARLTPKDVDYINAHATSTPVGDLSEGKAIEHLFGEYLDGLHVSATKSMTGHLLGAAGAIEAIVCILAVRNDIIPPTINLEEVDPQFHPQINFTQKEKVQKPVEVALSNTVGFGGHSVVSLFRKFRE
ncbi:beta-ketoacyl-ACP synthase II [Rapidithrix thailandica]|uniref:3-oxoacyl-[acyl-carrier-protein] synthase 2 n=1 Tax=Rapidithrix thailandica TaxID=413964 RepID=A0AAW9S1C6_9BACT